MHIMKTVFFLIKNVHSVIKCQPVSQEIKVPIALVQLVIFTSA